MRVGEQGLASAKLRGPNSFARVSLFPGNPELEARLPLLTTPCCPSACCPLYSFGEDFELQLEPATVKGLMDQV